MPNDPRKILWNNVVALMKHHWGKVNKTRLGREADAGQGTADRIEGGTNVGLDVLDRIAGVFGLKAWQLLVPNIDPLHPPTTRNFSAMAVEVARIFDAIKDEERRVKAYAVIVQVVEMGNAPQTPGPSPAPKQPHPKDH